MRHSSLASPLLLWWALVAFGSAPLHAQTIYRIVGPDGRLTFSDKAPLDLTKATASTASGKALNAGDTGMPYELRQIISRYPVTLYSGTSCVPCNAGRVLLQSRGVPFTEYSISTAEDVEALQRLSGDNSLPFLSIGGQKIKGYSEAEWVQFLNAANYPTSSKLPANYRNPPAKPLVAVQKSPAQNVAEAQPGSDEKSATSLPIVPAATPANAPSPDNPVGIKF